MFPLAPILVVQVSPPTTVRQQKTQSNGLETVYSADILAFNKVKTAGILGILPLLQREKYVAYNLKKLK
jgi:hypothetical protein